MELTVDDLAPALDSLIDKTLVSTWKAGHDRMAKYQHKLRHRVSDKLNFELPELAVLCVLFLRGPQTVGEIRTRCSRIYEFDSLSAATSVLNALQENPDGPYIAMLPRQEGRKESRYAHLFCGAPAETAMSATPEEKSAGSVSPRVEALEGEVKELKAALQALEQRFQEFKDQFE